MGLLQQIQQQSIYRLHCKRRLQFDADSLLDIHHALNTRDHFYWTLQLIIEVVTFYQ